MIRGLGFGKSVKLLLSTLLIGCFGLLGNSFVNAGYTQHLGTYINNPYDNNFDVNVLTKGQLMTSLLGDTKNLFIGRPVGSNYTVFFWDSNGLPYLFLNDSCKGEITNYYLCDELVGTETSITVNNGSNDNKHCGSSVLVSQDSTFQVFGNFLNSMTSSDYYYFNWGWTSSTSRPNLTFCYSSHSIGKSLCFESNSYSSCYLNDYLGLTGFTFNSVDSSLLKNPPSYDFGNSTGGNNVSNNPSNIGFAGSSSNLTGSYSYVNCTYGSIIDYLEKGGLNQYLCYGGLDNFDEYNPNTNYNYIPGYGKKLYEIYNYFTGYNSPLDWYNYWYGIYKGGLFNNIVDTPAVLHTWFDIYNSYNGFDYDFDIVYKYCRFKTSSAIQENLDNVYYGNDLKDVCSNIQYNNYGIYDSSGNVIVGVNWEGVGNYSGNNQNKMPLEYVQDFFNKLKSSGFSTQYGFGFGFLPLYICVFLFGLVVFRFISH